MRGGSLVLSVDLLQQLQLTPDGIDSCPHPKSVALGSRKLPLSILISSHYSFKVHNLGCLTSHLGCDLQVAGFTRVLTCLTLPNIQQTNGPFQDLGIPDPTPGPHRLIQQQDQHARQEPGPGVGPEPPQVTTIHGLRAAHNTLSGNKA